MLRMKLDWIGSMSNIYTFPNGIKQGKSRRSLERFCIGKI